MARPAHQIHIRHLSQAGEARRQAQARAAALGLSATVQDRVGVVATELATNILKHTTGGSIVMGDFGNGGLTLLALDAGPGIRSVARALEDGVSTAGTPGGGLGAVRRLADLFEITTDVKRGTVIVAGFGGAVAEGLDIAGITIPYPGEDLCGDAWSWRRGPDGTVTTLAVDGLGHGHNAAAAAAGAVEAFQASPRTTPADILTDVDQAIGGTRGAAGACAQILPMAGEVRYGGLGNTAGYIQSGHDGREQRCISHQGTLGRSGRRLRQETFTVSRPILLILTSDGVSSRWRMADYPGLSARSAAMIAGTLLRDHMRRRDDSLILVVKVP